MKTRYFSENDVVKQRKSYYTFHEDSASGEFRAFDGMNEELTLSGVKKIIDGLTSTYINIEEEEYRKRTLEQIKYDVETSFKEFNDGPPIKKYFRKDIVRHYKIECTNCLKKISTKTEEGYWAAQNWHIKISGKKFCSKTCTFNYINEIRNDMLTEKQKRYL